MKEWIEYGLNKAGTRLKYPFGDDIAVLYVGTKMFALCRKEGDSWRLNLKCDPDRAAALREQYECIQPGYHMNKRHWNTVILDGTLGDRELSFLIDHSYELVLSGLTKAEQVRIKASLA